MELHQLYDVHQPGDEWQEEDRAARAAVEGWQARVGGKVISGSPKPYNDSRGPLVIIESPYSGDVARNSEYARACLLDSLRRGEAPIASHLLHTQVLDDLRPDERELGIEAGLAWYRVAEKCVVYDDLGISHGMAEGTARARSHGVPVEYRRLRAWRDAA
ncbi:hypothetical protein FHW20_002097 [Ochrobactrum intermedium]|uniref:DUF7768 domain-containing protein n=2 Tax=Brucella intermedia TaxID=94625 RepID=A0ABR6AP37_9HYPH|nr:hypothetical protein [Brucella intermedia]MBA8851162.1 hypothetical protein [Brucella intermedia]MDH0125393.1 hypothetical protein [Brucella intermedia GD04153]